MLSGLSLGAARSRAEGVTAKPTRASPVNLYAGISHFPQPRNKKGNHPTSGCYCLALVQSFPRSGFQSGLWTCRACGVGNCLQIDFVHQPVPKARRTLSLTSTPDLQSVREMTLWRWMTHSCTLTELREAFGPHICSSPLASRTRAPVPGQRLDKVTWSLALTQPWSHHANRLSRVPRVGTR